MIGVFYVWKVVDEDMDWGLGVIVELGEKRFWV